MAPKSEATSTAYRLYQFVWFLSTKYF